MTIKQEHAGLRWLRKIPLADIGDDPRTNPFGAIAKNCNTVGPADQRHCTTTCKALCARPQEKLGQDG